MCVSDELHCHYTDQHRTENRSKSALQKWKSRDYASFFFFFFPQKDPVISYKRTPNGLQIAPTKGWSIKGETLPPTHTLCTSRAKSYQEWGGEKPHKWTVAPLDSAMALQRKGPLFQRRRKASRRRIIESESPCNLSYCPRSV